MTKGALKLYVKPSQNLGLNNSSCILSLMSALSPSLPYPGSQNLLFILSMWQWKLWSAFYTMGWPNKKVSQDLINEKGEKFSLSFWLSQLLLQLCTASWLWQWLHLHSSNLCLYSLLLISRGRRATTLLAEVTVYLESEGRNLIVCSLRCQSKLELTYQERPKLIGLPRTNLTCILTELGFCTKCGRSGVCLLV